VTGGIGEPGRPGDDAPRSERRRGGHVERAGRPRMRELAAGAVSWRAVAEADVAVSPETLSAIVDGQSPRGDVLTVAELAGVMAAKRTSELIPLGHTVPLAELVVRAVPDRSAGAVRITAETGALGRSGVEMEALTAAAIAALTLYDMIRETDPGAAVKAIKLVSRSGGEAGAWERPAESAAGRGAPGGRAGRGGRAAGRLTSGPRPGGPARNSPRRNPR
jgi:cyclic pyranopterin phosphate synthase